MKLNDLPPKFTSMKSGCFSLPESVDSPEEAVVFSSEEAVVLSTVAEDDVVPSVAFEEDVVLSDLPELVVEADSVEGVVGVSLSPQAVSATMPRIIARAISKEIIFFICFLLDLFFGNKYFRIYFIILYCFSQSFEANTVIKAKKSI